LKNEDVDFGDGSISSDAAYPTCKLDTAALPAAPGLTVVGTECLIDRGRLADRLDLNAPVERAITLLVFGSLLQQCHGAWYTQEVISRIEGFVWQFCVNKAHWITCLLEGI
jgi:hypothetical protein